MNVDSVIDTENLRGGTPALASLSPPPPAAAKAQSIAPDILRQIPVTHSVVQRSPRFLECVDLLTTGGMQDGSKFSSLISLLQALKSSQSFALALYKSLNLGSKEDPEILILRQDIQSQIVEILTISSNGETVTREKVAALHHSLSQLRVKSRFCTAYEQELDTLWRFLFVGLELTPLLVDCESDSISSYASTKLAYGVIYKYGASKSYYYEKLKKERFKNAPDIFAVFINQMNSSYDYHVNNYHFKVEPISDIELNCCDQVERYHLVSCVARIRDEYSVAYLKVNETGQWVQFHNTKVTPLVELSKEHKKGISILFYQKYLKKIH